MKFGDVVRRKNGPTVMWIGKSTRFFETDEMAISEGTDIAFTLNRNGYDDPSYWPLHGTADGDLLKHWLKSGDGEELP